MINDFMYNIWYNTYDPNFIDLSKKSFIPEKWLKFQPVLNGKYSDSIIKPINKYVENLYPYPELIDISNNIVRLRQKNHAEIFLLIKDDGEFYNLDRPWMRQYYQSLDKQEIPKNCFPGVYKFYTPWVIDEDIDVFLDSPASESPFYLYPSSSKFSKISLDSEYVEPNFVSFSFKNIGPHMAIDKKFGKIKRMSPMYDIVFEANDIIVEKIRKFYEHS